ncbi:hypothetical protein NQ318_005549 [Aromia moschata]|uniref:Uncharacterized protein n=1 Tax=Aromia moschata TaxID=1265417 RepID=A0AAV8X1L1_9CUCU|nr:hypothetical protein NQ318_005549 [Aromia moschata]
MTWPNLNLKESKKRRQGIPISSTMENGELPVIHSRSNIKGDEKSILLLFFPLHPARYSFGFEFSYTHDTAEQRSQL